MQILDILVQMYYVHVRVLDIQYVIICTLSEFHERFQEYGDKRVFPLRWSWSFPMWHKNDPSNCPVGFQKCTFTKHTCSLGFCYSDCKMQNIYLWICNSLMTNELIFHKSSI